MNEINEDKQVGGFTEVEGYFKSKKVSLSGWRCPKCKVVELAQDLASKVKYDEADGIKVKVRVPKCRKCKYIDWSKTIEKMNSNGGVAIKIS